MSRTGESEDKSQGETVVSDSMSQTNKTENRRCSVSRYREGSILSAIHPQSVLSSHHLDVRIPYQFWPPTTINRHMRHFIEVKRTPPQNHTGPRAQAGEERQCDSLGSIVSPSDSSSHRGRLFARHMEVGGPMAVATRAFLWPWSVSLLAKGRPKAAKQTRRGTQPLSHNRCYRPSCSPGTSVPN